jgi:hypothetical protein
MKMYLNGGGKDNFTYVKPHCLLFSSLLSLPKDRWQAFEITMLCHLDSTSEKADRLL